MRMKNSHRSTGPQLVSAQRSMSPFMSNSWVRSSLLWLFAIECALALGSPELTQSSDPSLVCDTGTYSVHGGYPGARTGSCTVDGSHEVKLTIEPEDNGNINPSPWYGFKVVRESGKSPGNSRALEVVLTYAQHHEHRYWPQVSLDGINWDPLPETDLKFNETDRSVRLLLSVAESEIYVSAQPNLQADWYASWTQQLVQSWPEMKRELIGFSAERRPIEAIFTQGEATFLVIIMGRAHPPETTGAQALREFMLHMATMRRESCAMDEPDPVCLFFVDYDILLVPLLNPDGVVGGHWRHNANGVDLNRDWGANSQPETAAVQTMLDSLLASGRKPRLVLDFHSTRRNVFYTQTEEDVTNPPAFTRRWLKRAAGIASEHEIDLPVYEHAPREVSTQGTAKNHFFVKYRIPSITYETGEAESLDEIRRGAHIFARAMVDTLMSDAELPYTGISLPTYEGGGDSAPVASPRLCHDFYCYMSEANKASLVMLRSRELISETQAQNIGTALMRAIREASETGADRTNNYLQLENRLIELAGIEASNIHLGRSRQDLHGVTRRMLFRNQLLDVLNELVSARENFLATASRNQDVVIPAYTHGVPSQPTTFGHQLAAFASALERDFSRLTAAYHRLNRSPLGAAAGSTSGYPLDSHLMSDLLGFAAPVANSYDANFLSSSDYRIEVASALQGSALTVTQFVENVHSQQRNPWPWIYLAAEATSGSSIMPQKRNPRDLDRLRSSAGSVIGHAHRLVLFAHNVDSGMHDYRQMTPTLELFVDAHLMYRRLDRLISIVQVNREKALEEVNNGFSTMTEVADTVHRQTEIPFRTAHAFAARLVEIARQRGIRGIDLDVAEMRRVFQEITGEKLTISNTALRTALDPQHFITSRRGVGGPQPDELIKSLEALDTTLDDDQRELQGMRAALGKAHLRLQRQFEKLLSLEAMPHSTEQ